jgi:hypothetical protein
MFHGIVLSILQTPCMRATRDCIEPLQTGIVGALYKQTRDMDMGHLRRGLLKRGR